MKSLPLILLPVVAFAGCVHAQTTPELAQNDAQLTQTVDYDGVPRLQDIAFAPLADPLPTTGDVLFVAPDARPGAAGTPQSPAILLEAIAKAPAGATIVLRGGSYRDVSSLALPKPVTLRAYPGEVPMLLGSDIVSNWTPEGATWKAAWDKKWTFEAPKDGDARTIDARYPRAADLDMAFIDGKPLVQVASLAEVKPGTFHIDTQAKQLHLGEDPTGKKVEVSARGWGIEAQGKGKTSPGITLRGLAFAHFAKTGAQVFASDARIEKCLAAWNGEGGFGMRGKNIVLRDCVAVANGRKGATISRSEGARVENNFFQWNNVERFRTAWDAAGIKMTVTRDALFAGNRFERNLSSALWMDISVMQARVVKNTLIDNAGIAIFVELQHDSIVAFNTCINNGTGIQVADSSKTEVWNNILVGNGRAILIKDSMRVNVPGSVDTTGLGNIGTSDEAARLGATWESHSNTFFNNLLIGPKPGERPKASFLFDAGGVHPDKSSAEMIGASGSNLFVVGISEGAVRWKAGKNGSQTNFPTLEAFRAANAALEKGSVMVSSVEFKDAKGGDYTLKTPVAGLQFAPLPESVKKATREAGIEAG